MRILVATDSYKGSMDAAAATSAIARGLAGAWPEAAITPCPLTDGGEGFVSTLVAAAGGGFAEAQVSGPLGEPATARYGVLEEGAAVVVELSSAAGLVQVPPARRDPLVTTTYGVGELIAEAYARHGFERLYLGLGGSATVDGGAGLLSALGVRFLDAAGRPVPRGGGGLAAIAAIDTADASPLLNRVSWTVAVDVDNPLVGPRGAAPVYGPQKGADPGRVATLEAGLVRLADALEAATGVRVHDVPGCGSAGGVPAGLLALAGATLTPGFELAAVAVGLDGLLAATDLVVTGEGQLDRQSFEGKVVGRLAARCRVLGLPLVALVGAVEEEGAALMLEGGGSAWSIVPGPMPLEEAMREGERLLERQAAMLGRLLTWR